MEKKRDLTVEFKDAAIEAVLAVAPLVAEHLKVLEAINLLKAGAVRHFILERKLTKSATAAYLGLSPRWVYKQLAQWERYLEAKTPLRVDVLAFFEKRHPEAVTARECSEALVEQGVRIEEDILLDVLEAYAHQGFLKTIDGRYQWAGRAVVAGVAPDTVTRTQRVKESLRPIMSLVRKFMDTGEGEFARFATYSVTPEALELFKAEMRQALEQGVERAVARSREADPLSQGENISIEGLLVWGPCSKPPDERKK